MYKVFTFFYHLIFTFILDFIAILKLYDEEAYTLYIALVFKNTLLRNNFSSN